MRMKHTAFFVIVLLLSANSLYCQNNQFTTSPVKIFFSVFGQGKPLLLINGGPGYSSGHLNEVALRLSTVCKVILFDQRGTGKSAVPELNAQTINLKETLLDIEHIRTELKLDSWMVAGHSFGGLIAMAYAATHGDRVEKLILMSSAGADLSFIQGFQDNIANIIGKDTVNYQMPATASNEEVFLNMVKTNAPAYVFDKSKTELVRSKLVNAEDFVYDVNRWMFSDLFKTNFDVSENLKAYKKPVLIIQGAQDIVGMDTAYKTHSILKNSMIFFIPRCGHIPWMEKPHIFYNEVLKFLAE